MNPIFDPRDSHDKSPYGAVPKGKNVTFTLRPARRQGFSRGWLTARLEQREDAAIVLPMPWQSTQGGVDAFSCVLDPGGYVGLIWYSFRLEGFGGRQWDSPEYQLTVYDNETDVVPDWFGQGMCYQIFPDRFCRTQIPDPTGMVGGRTIHQDWSEEPEYRPDAKGEVRNRDFFGGNLAGITEKLDDLAELGVETIYLCPIFEAAENHRYGTADYSRIDPMLGGEADFARLCREAHRRGMRILLDGVFNHVGYVSRYFNGDGAYGPSGAAQSRLSPYYDWFSFTHWPDKYESWWGIYSLPAVNKTNESYRRFIYEGEDSVVRRWLRAGADGWRLDVADELPDEFVAGIHRAVRKEKPDAMVIGEVWEDGTTKIAYGVRRKHLLGGHLDGLMNYPFRTALIDFLLGGPGENFRETMETLRENYPPFAFYNAMNALGTHDTLRILTYLGVGSQKLEESKDWRAKYRMTPQELERGLARLRLGAMVLFAFPGAPTVYYGDEVGMTGFEDPFNRRTFPWGREDRQLKDFFRTLGNLRKKSAPLRRGALVWGDCRDSAISFARMWQGETAVAAVNAGDAAVTVNVPCEVPVTEVFTGKTCLPVNGLLAVELGPMEGILAAGAAD